MSITSIWLLSFNLIIYVLSDLVKSNNVKEVTWDYNKRIFLIIDGDDWEGNCKLKNINQSPLNLKNFPRIKENSFFDFIEQQLPNNIFTIKYEQEKRLLVLEANNSFGSLRHNFYEETDPFEGIVTMRFVNYDCSKIYVKLPAEHIVDDNKFDLELQILCTGIPQYGDYGSPENDFITIPTKIGENESLLFSSMKLENIIDNGQFEIKGFNEFLNILTPLKGLYYYKGTETNFINRCTLLNNWIVLKDNYATISQSKYDKFKSLIWNEFATSGNNRNSSNPTETKADKNIYNLVKYSK